MKNSINLILFFAEDPGAVNYLAPLASHLIAIGKNILLLSSGHATSLLKKRGLEPVEVNNSDHAVSLYTSSEADLLLVGTSENLDSPGLALIAHAKKAGHASVGLVDYFANAGFRFRGNTVKPLAYAPDWLVVPDSWTAKEYEDLGFDKNKIVIAGHPQYDLVLQQKNEFDRDGRCEIRKRILPENAQGKTIIVFVSELSTGLDPLQYQYSKEYTLNGRGQSKYRTDIVMEEFLDAISGICNNDKDRPFLILRLHPKDSIQNQEKYINEFDLVSQGGEPLEVLYTSDLVVGMSSMLLLEAYLLSLNVLSIVPRSKEREWLPITRMNSIPCVTHKIGIDKYFSDFFSTSFNNSGPVVEGHSENADIVEGAINRCVYFIDSLMA
jgi:hypothetical protein